MIHGFDIFQTETDGNVVWQGTAASTEEATALVLQFARNSPGDYIILDLQTGTRRVMKCHPADAAGRSIANPDLNEA
jgi:hypothetical protein